MSTETIVTILTGLGVIVAIFTALGGFFFTMRKDIQAVDTTIRREISELRTELRTEMHSGDGALRTEMQAGFESIRTEMRSADDALRHEISELRAETKADFRSLNDRLDGTNMRMDRLVDSLRAPIPA